MDRVADRQVNRLLAYVKATALVKLTSTVDKRDRGSLTIQCFPDADHAGCPETAKSTSGGWSELAGSGTAAGVAWYSKRQGSVSHSTTEAETISADKMLREVAIPMQCFWGVLLRYEPKIVLNEDNQATIAVWAAGYSKQLRYLAKTQCVDLAFCHERLSQDDCEMNYIETSLQKGDLYTKGLARAKLESACALIGLG